MNVGVAMHAPEVREHPIEDAELFGPMDEQRAAGVIHLVACAKVDLSERLDDVEHTAGMHIDAFAPQDAAEDEQVFEEIRHAATSRDPALRLRADHGPFPRLPSLSTRHRACRRSPQDRAYPCRGRPARSPNRWSRTRRAP